MWYGGWWTRAAGFRPGGTFVFAVEVTPFVALAMLAALAAAVTRHLKASWWLLAAPLGTVAPAIAGLWMEPPLTADATHVGFVLVASGLVLLVDLVRLGRVRREHVVAAVSLMLGAAFTTCTTQLYLISQEEQLLLNADPGYLAFAGVAIGYGCATAAEGILDAVRGLSEERFGGWRVWLTGLAITFASTTVASSWLVVFAAQHVHPERPSARALARLWAIPPLAVLGVTLLAIAVTGAWLLLGRWWRTRPAPSGSVTFPGR